MPHEVFNPEELGPPSGFSHAIRSGNAVYLAGQIGEGATLVEQFDDALGNLLTAIRAAGGEVTDLVSLQVFVTDLTAYRASLPGLGKAWRKHCDRHYPAMGLFGVTGLFDPSALVELMGIAVIAGEAPAD
jgi:enamine deaminase RidA (YjgF/YER057c/UK114 family)